MMSTKVTFIGAGSIAESILSGMLSKQFVAPEQVFMTNHANRDRLRYLKEKYAVQASPDKKTAADNADIVVLAVKPKDAESALNSIKSFLTADQLVISLMAGVSASYIESTVGLNIPVVRAMPNTSASIGQSATAIAPGKFANHDHVEKAKALFQTVGTVAVVDEADLHAITGLSGSGPAYIYYLIEAMTTAAKEEGLADDTAKQLIIQTLAGAAEMLKTSDESPSELRRKITSPGGTTQAGIETLESYHFQEAVIACVKAATKRSVELGSPFVASV